MKKIKKATDALREELKKPLPEHQPTKEKKVATKKKGKKSNKKSSKKVAKKGGKKKAAAKKSKKTQADGGVTLVSLAKEAGVSGQKARQKLRAAGIEREEGSRWSWKDGSKVLKAARKALGL